MNTRYRLKDQLCISTLSMIHISLDNSHRFEMKTRKVHNSFGYITHGSVVFSTMTENVHAKEGDIVFIPEGGVSIGLPVACVNAVLSLMPMAILRYHTAPLLRLYERCAVKT